MITLGFVSTRYDNANRGVIPAGKWADCDVDVSVDEESFFVIIM